MTPDGDNRPPMPIHDRPLRRIAQEEREEFLLDNPGLHWRHVEESEGSGVPSQMKLDNPEFAKALHKKHAEGKKKLEFSQAELNELMGAKRQSVIATLSTTQ